MDGNSRFHGKGIAGCETRHRAEILATTGALAGPYSAAALPAGVIAVIFGLVPVYSGCLSSRDRPESLVSGGRTR